MRTIEITKELQVEIEPLRLKQIKALRKAGYMVSSVSFVKVEEEKWDDFVEAVIRAHAPDRADEILKALGDFDNHEYRRVCKDFLGETWGIGSEEKN